MVIILAILLIVYLYTTENKEKEEQKKKSIIGYDTRTGVPLYEGEKVLGYDTQTGRAIISGREEKKKDKIEDKSKISNSILMIVGAGLIVFASVVFLTSSWDTIPNIVKPLVLIFIQVIFFAFYKICDKKLDIPKTGRVFKFLSFMFIPIVLISLSCFELIGEELSIKGEYADLYFAASFIVSAIVFKVYTKFDNDLSLKVASYFLETLGLFCIAIHIDEEYIYGLLLSVYTTIYYILLHGNFLDKKAYSRLNSIVTIITMFACYINLFGRESFLYYIPFAIYTVLFFTLYFINKEDKEQRRSLCLFFVNYFATVSYISTLDIPKYPMYLLFVIPLLIVAKISKKENIKNFFQILVLSSTTILVVLNLINASGDYYDTLTYGLGFTIYLLSWILFNNKYRSISKLLTYSSSVLVLCDLCYRLEIDELAKYVGLVVAVFVYLLETATPGLKDQWSNKFITGLLYIEQFVLTANSIGNENYALLVPFVLLLIYQKLEKEQDNILIIPALLSLAIYTKDTSTLSVTMGIILAFVYAGLSFLKQEFSIYSFLAPVAILFGLLDLEVNKYVVYTLLGVWSFASWFFKKERKELYVLTSIVAVLGIYFSILNDLDVDFKSLYYLGLYGGLFAIVSFIFNKNDKSTVLFAIIGFIILTLSSLIIIEEAMDAITMIVILFFITIYKFFRKDKPLLYCSIVAMIIHVIKQTLEFWESVPIYIYVLLIGLALILFAMFDERLNIIKKNPKKEEDKKE